MLEIITPRELPAVLLIDDDMVSREVMATLLTMSGYPVHTAEGGEAALTILDGPECSPGVILMDAQMPGLSGLPLMAELRTRSQARIYVISASSTPDDVMAAADGFLLKPFQPEALTLLLEGQEGESNPPAAETGLDPAEVVVDPKTLEQLRAIMPAAGVHQIFEAILIDLGRRSAALRAAIANRDWPEIRRIGHAIKGGGAMAGAFQLARLGALIESGALEPNVNQSDNSSVILADLTAARQNLKRMLDVEFKASVSQDAGG